MWSLAKLAKQIPTTALADSLKKFNTITCKHTPLRFHIMLWTKLFSVQTLQCELHSCKCHDYVYVQEENCVCRSKTTIKWELLEEDLHINQQRQICDLVLKTAARIKRNYAGEADEHTFNRSGSHIWRPPSCTCACSLGENWGILSISWNPHQLHRCTDWNITPNIAN